MAKKEAIYDIFHSYDSGDLAAALVDAARFVKDIGEDRVVHVIARLDENIAGAWWVDVVYRVKYER